jgi:hypothetical protein
MGGVDDEIRRQRLYRRLARNEPQHDVAVRAYRSYLREVPAAVTHEARRPAGAPRES